MIIYFRMRRDTRIGYKKLREKSAALANRRSLPNGRDITPAAGIESGERKSLIARDTLDD